MAIYFNHGHLPSCDDCRRVVYDHDWRPVIHRGQPLPRDPGSPLQCRTCPKSHDGKPNPGAEMRGRHWLTFQIWLQTRAGCPVPEDHLLRQHLGLIQLVFEQRRLRQPTGLSELLAAALSGRN